MKKQPTTTKTRDFRQKLQEGVQLNIARYKVLYEKLDQYDKGELQQVKRLSRLSIVRGLV